MCEANRSALPTYAWVFSARCLFRNRGSRTAAGVSSELPTDTQLSAVQRGVTALMEKPRLAIVVGKKGEDETGLAEFLLQARQQATVVSHVAVGGFICLFVCHDFHHTLLSS